MVLVFCIGSFNGRIRCGMCGVNEMTQRDYINMSCKVRLDDALNILTHHLVWENLPDGIDVSKFQNAVRDLYEVSDQIKKLIEASLSEYSEDSDELNYMELSG